MIAPNTPGTCSSGTAADGTYSEVAQLSGVEAADWCWCPVFLDVDLDGYEDLLMVTGHERDAMNIDLSRRIEATLKQRPLSRLAQLQLRSIFPVYDTPNFAFRNRGDLTFEEVGASWGFDSNTSLTRDCLGGPGRRWRLGRGDQLPQCRPLIYRNESQRPAACHPPARSGTQHARDRLQNPGPGWRHPDAIPGR